MFRQFNYNQSYTFHRLPRSPKSEIFLFFHMQVSQISLQNFQFLDFWNFPAKQRIIQPKFRKLVTATNA